MTVEKRLKASKTKVSIAYLVKKNPKHLYFGRCSCLGIVTARVLMVILLLMFKYEGFCANKVRAHERCTRADVVATTLCIIRRNYK